MADTSVLIYILVGFLVVGLVWKYGPELIKNEKLRKMIMTLFVLAFSIAAIAGLLGAFITKAAPIL